jgi:hypothetical protein
VGGGMMSGGGGTSFDAGFAEQSIYTIHWKI